MNNLLGLYHDIERKYYKLWLSSTNVLESILHKRIENWAAFEMDRIKGYSLENKDTSFVDLLFELWIKHDYEID